MAPALRRTWGVERRSLSVSGGKPHIADNGTQQTTAVCDAAACISCSRSDMPQALVRRGEDIPDRGSDADRA